MSDHLASSFAVAMPWGKEHDGKDWQMVDSKKAMQQAKKAAKDLQRAAEELEAAAKAAEKSTKGKCKEKTEVLDVCKVIPVSTVRSEDSAKVRTACLDFRLCIAHGVHCIVLYCIKKTYTVA